MNLMATAAPEIEETTPHQPVTAVDAAAAPPRLSQIEASRQIVPAANGNPAAKIDYELLLDCVHCGLCTASCPTYVETGNENDSPRGRIYLMRAVTDGRLAMGPDVRRHLELCLDCRACESACPSGVQYGSLIEPFKIAMQKDAPAEARASLLERLILHHLFPYAGRVKAALLPARVFQKLGILDWAERKGL